MTPPFQGPELSGAALLNPFRPTRRPELQRGHRSPHTGRPRVLDGRVHLSDEINDRLLQSIAEGGSSSIGESPLNALIDRELEVYELTGHGLGTRAIADRLEISIKTVESYRSRIKKKLNISDVSQLMRHADRWVQDE